MSQAILERPAVTKPPGKKTADRAADPREKITRQFSELVAGIAAMVEAEESDCLGRVLEFAGKEVRRALAESVEGEVGASYRTMLDADSLMQAAASLAAREHHEKNQQRARWTEATRLAELSDSILIDQDRLLTRIGSERLSGVAGQVEPAAAVADLSASNPDDACGWIDIALETLQTRLQELNSNAAYGVRSLIRLAKQSMEVYQSDPTNDDAYDQATMDMGIAMGTLDAFNNDDVDDLVLYAVALALEKALSCIEGVNEGGRQ